jgi:hypothetical protein
MRNRILVLFILTANIAFAQLPCGLTAITTPSGAAKFMLCEGSSSKSVTFTNLKAAILSGGSVASNVVITNLTGLRSLPDSSVSASKLYYITDVDQEGFWKYNATGTVIDNTGLSVLTPTNKVMQRIVENNDVNVNWFGAHPDSTTNSTTAIQLATNSIGRYRLVFTKGTYLINNTISLNNHIDMFIEEGARIKVINVATTTIRVFRATVANLNIKIAGKGILDGSKASIASVTNTIGFNYSIPSTSASIDISGITIKDCKGSAGYGIVIADIDNVKIKDVKVLDTDYTAIYIDATSRNVSNITVKDCYIDRVSSGLTASEGGIKIRGASFPYKVSNVLVENNNVRMAVGTFSTSAAIPIELFRNVDYARVTDNHTYGGVIGISLASVKFATVGDNTVFAPKDYCYELANCQNSTLSGNVGNGDNVTSVGVSMNSGSTFCTVTGNSLDSMVVASIQVHTCSTSTLISNPINARNGYAIELINSKDMVITGNNLLGNSVASKAIMFNTSGSSTVIGNRISGFTQNNGLHLYAVTAYTFDNITYSGNIANGTGVGIEKQLSGGALLGGNIKMSDNSNVPDVLSLSDSVTFRQGAGSPEGVVFAKQGALYLCNNCTYNSTIWYKTGAYSNTGWFSTNGVDSTKTPYYWSGRVEGVPYYNPISDRWEPLQISAPYNTTITLNTSNSTYAVSHNLNDINTTTTIRDVMTNEIVFPTVINTLNTNTIDFYQPLSSGTRDYSVSVRKNTNGTVSPTTLTVQKITASNQASMVATVALTPNIAMDFFVTDKTGLQSNFYEYRPNGLGGGTYYAIAGSEHDF